MEMKPIAIIHTDFTEKFGIPRQSGRVETLAGRIVFLPEYRDESALRGLSDFSHIWLLFDFSKAHRAEWSPTVRPPRLGGNTRVGVFASRSPFRPNPIGLSVVRLEAIRKTEEGSVLIVSGVDLLDGTPIWDIKPYLPHTDAVTEASGSYADREAEHALLVDFPPQLLSLLPPEKREAAKGCLKEDPRPSYQADPHRVYHMLFAGYDIHFTVSENVLSVVDVTEV